ncbi:Valacyclovir hydrolase [Galemys pyrenaicus]|uniref:Valacyclovir hydrolase n=1 Tax=Galemys pyrenaicus TaxID=202257 RepID=A0A8J6AMG7_GALPY|nr:Valacyclovir hydrolase [Galemys pyrenaicus]
MPAFPGPNGVSLVRCPRFGQTIALVWGSLPHELLRESIMSGTLVPTGPPAAGLLEPTSRSWTGAMGTVGALRKGSSPALGLSKRFAGLCLQLGLRPPCQACRSEPERAGASRSEPELARVGGSMPECGGACGSEPSVQKLHLMPEGKHNLHLRFADEFNALVEDFLK